MKAKQTELIQKKPIKVRFFEPSLLTNRFKATIHKTGKLGFTNIAAKKLLLNKGCRFQIGVNQEDPKDTCLYMMQCKNDSKDGFLVARAGEYYYINLTVLFDSLGIDYTSKKIIFDITKIEHNGQSIYKLEKRDK